MSENKCPQCGAPIDPDSTECKYCGEKIVISTANEAETTESNIKWSDVSIKGMNIKNQSKIGIIMTVLGIFVSALFPLVYGALVYTGTIKPEGLKVDAKKEGKYSVIQGIIFIFINIFFYYFVY